MSSLSELKEQIKQEASENPDKFFATDVLREKGFTRDECTNCGMMFWAADENRDVCGEPECSGGYTFINDSPTDEEFSYVGSWNLFRDFMDDRGYEPIDRYPVIARWRDDVEFVQASIYNFQPHVVSGEAEPPADELVVPQPCLRFNDVDNVGITGRHYTNFIMIGQDCFQPDEKYDQDRYFRDMFDFAVDELGIPREKLILHEESWGGGGNLGACMEFFADGLELWNQVYMFYEITPNGYEELDLKVLDMGMGMERLSWISHGTETSYECVMPSTLKNMKERTGLETDEEVWEAFLPHSSKLNVDEVDDIDQKWQEIADEIDIDVNNLKESIKPAAALYSVAEHSRALLFALADGKLPSNTGGGHNLRLIYRRAKDFIEKYDWDIDMEEVAEWNAEELEPMFPELVEKLPEVKEILEVEAEKYQKARMNALDKLENLDEQPSLERMIELYESHGVSPEMMEEHGFKVPEDFYAKVASEDEETEAEQDTEIKHDLEGIPDTELLYYEDEYQKEMEAEVLKATDSWVVLDKTVFYPEGGGQENDKGRINGEEVVDVQKQNDVVLHKIPGNDLEEGDRVEGRINWERRFQLMQHHSTTHAVNGATKDVLGNHIWQAGAHKKVEKARLDVTHYDNIDRETLDKIEEKVRTYIWEDLEIRREVLEKSDAEKKYGFRIYQGGAPPGNKVRIIKIVDQEENDKVIDVEACGGTHLKSTAEAEEFVITGSNKVQDGVIRLNYKAGEAAVKHINQIRNRINRISEELNVPEPDNHREVQRELVDIFSVEPDHLESTVENFLSDNNVLKSKIRRLSDYLGIEVDIPVLEGNSLEEICRSLFEVRKEREKQLENLESELEEHVRTNIEDRVFEQEVPTENIGLLIQVARKLAKDYEASITLIGEKGAVSASYHEDYDADENLEKYSSNVQGGEEFAKAFDLDQ